MKINLQTQCPKILAVERLQAVFSGPGKSSGVFLKKQKSDYQSVKR
jgi:hypothetical protein